MDRGAHFYRCDFQVHSPRDRNWSGKKFGVASEACVNLTDEQKDSIERDREQFAKEYLQLVRNSGLNAIAITDHHDVVFLKAIRKVAQEENENFADNQEFDKIVTIFPGIEMTFSTPPCQCLLLFDSDFNDADLSSVINYFGVLPSDDYDKNTFETERISTQTIGSLNDLHQKLDELKYCIGRYILLPNVNKGGQYTILRSGCQETYRKMPCVGGYVDKAISTDSGYQNKLSGGDVNYGNKSIAVLSTSDNRYEDGRELGKHSTWIKWAEPTAEAVRQACLAKESRISQDEPNLPQMHLKTIEVTSSKFLGSFELSLNRQYNAFIGGRGTGKSTILEYIRWGLCDQPSQQYDELSTIERRRNALINKTLRSEKGEVRIVMEKNGVQHIVKRDSDTNSIFLKIGEGDFDQVKEDDIRKLLPIQAYSQKQLSDVGVRTEELKRFIEQPILEKLNSIKFKISEISIRIQEFYNQYIRKREIAREVSEYQLQLSSLNSQVDTLKKSLKGVSEKDQATINKKAKYEYEGRFVGATKSDLSRYERLVDELIESLDQYSENTIDMVQIENKNEINSISKEYSAVFSDVRKAADILKGEFGANKLGRLYKTIAIWEQKKNEYEEQYEVAKKKSSSSKQQIEEIQRLETRISEINKIILSRESLLKEIGEPEVEFAENRRAWKELHERKIELLNKQAIEFFELSKNIIDAEVAKQIELKEFKVMIKSIYEGTRIREDKIDAILEFIKDAENPLKAYIDILEELRLIAEIKISDECDLMLPDTPILKRCGYTNNHIEKLCNKITTADWLRLAVSEINFEPKFSYTTNNKMGDIIPFEEASAGQQATALLTVLLNQSGIPLLIDQPEDDIDNRAIDQIVNNIWDSKSKRQLLFTSHNANLVVNGDAELVVCCDYRDTSSQTRGIIKAEGAIDNKVIRGEITTVMEGGEKAFKLRKDKYGF